MLRFLLAPRRLVLHLVASVLVAAMTVLGFWQLDRALASSGPPPRAADPAAVPLDRLSVPGQLLPGQAYGRRVSVVGEFDARHQTLLGGRRLAGRQGSWVLTPLRPAGGPAVAVVRGWVESGGEVSSPPAGTVRVVGRAYPSRQPAPVGAGPGVGVGTGAARPVDLSALAGRLPYALRDGFVVTVRQQPADTSAALRALRAAPWPSKAQGFPLQNAAYAVQWWLFAAFACYMWWRMLRDQWRERRPGRSEAGAAGDHESLGATSDGAAPVVEHGRG